MRLKAGYSSTCIAANYATARKEYGQTVAIALAHAEARKSYWRKFPRGFLPAWIYPDRESGRNNPALGAELEIKPNPASVQTRSHTLAKGVALYSGFVGKAPAKAKMVTVSLPHALVAIGRVAVIQYVAERDGKTYEFRHPFKVSSRPHLAVTPDGKLALMLGGAWRFSKDGFIDK